MLMAMLMGGGNAGPPTHKRGQTYNYSTQADRDEREVYARGQRAKGGDSAAHGGTAGWNRDAYNSLNGGNQGWQMSSFMNDMRNFNVSPGYSSGWTPQGAITGLQFNMAVSRAKMATQKHNLRTYPLGVHSEAFYNKFARWGESGPQGNRGWEGTLKAASGAKSTFGSTSMFKDEVFQTRETRSKSDLHPWNILPRHGTSSKLNPNLAHMYKVRNVQLGAVRRTVKRRF
jgi:hypothetical protein